MSERLSSGYECFKPLFEQAVAVDTLVLTPNLRLSRFVHSQYAVSQRAGGLEAWPSFPCFSFSAWTQSLWEAWQGLSSEPLPILMNATQEASLWLSVLRSEGAQVGLFNPSATASECRRAWNALLQWQIDLESLEGGESLSPEFSGWLQAYQAECAQKDLIDQASMLNRLIGAVEHGLLPLPSRMVLVAFDDINPQMQALILAVEERGCAVENFSPSVESSGCSRVVARDAEDELVRSAEWAAAIVSAHPEARVGVVIPKLLPLRTQVERIFTDVFEPQYKLPDAPRHASPFNMSAGISLNNTRPIATALLALKLNFRALSMDDIAQLLHSPFIGAQAEMPARALLEERLRENNDELRISALRTALGGFGRSRKKKHGQTGDRGADDGSRGDETIDAPSLLQDLYARLQEFHQLANSVPKKQAPSRWGELFCSQWQALGWPGDRPLDTLEFQQVEVWQQAITQLAGFDYCFPEVTLNQAIEFLERISLDTQFQAQTMDSPVQVLGLFEAAGLVFDYLWVMNLDNESWPAPTRPNSLLPYALQKQHQMPMASVERELALGRRITERFERSAEHLVVSHYAVDGDKELQVSALVEHIPSAELDSLSRLSSLSYLDVIFNSRSLEVGDDAMASFIRDPSSVRGGSQILKDQAACPFRAFAKHRLQAKVAEDFVPGITAATRGSLIHRALEIIWEELKDQKTLLALSEEPLASLIDASIENSFKAIKGLSRIGEKLKSLEHKRMHVLLRAWLELEKQREPFSVLFNESKKTVHLARLPIHVRFDRIDRLDDGRTFVLDYKTGKVDVRSWTGDRPDEPQVPLYAIAHRASVSGVAFGQLNVNGVLFKGVGDSADVAPGISTPDALSRLDLPETWPEVVAHWQAVLEGLSHEFITGVAVVKPKSRLNSCRYCDLQSLCRINAAPVDVGVNADVAVTAGGKSS